MLFSPSAGLANNAAPNPEAGFEQPLGLGGGERTVKREGKEKEGTGLKVVEKTPAK